MSDEKSDPLKALLDWADSEEPFPLFESKMSLGSGVIANPRVDLVVEKNGTVERTRYELVPDIDDQAE